MKVYTHVLNVAVEGSLVRSTGYGKLSETRAAGLAPPASRPKTGRASRWTRHKFLQGKRLPPQTGNRPIRLRPTETGFIQVSLRRS